MTNPTHPTPRCASDSASAGMRQDADTKAKYATIHAENHVEAMRVYAADTKDLGAIV